MIKTTVVLVLMLTVCLSKSQDIHFSQFNEAPLLVNPALTGFFDGSHRLQLNYKNQWRSVNNAYNTYAMGYDVVVIRGRNSSGFLAVGAAFFSDVSGDVDLKTASGQLNIAYHLKLNESQMLAAGIYGGFGQRSLNQQNMQWSSQYNSSSGFDATLPSNEVVAFESVGYVDFGFGMNWSLVHNSSSNSSNDGLKINAGFSLNHVNQPDFDFIGNADESLNLKMVAHSRALIGLSCSNMALVPSVYFQIQGTQKEILPGFMLRYMLREQSHYTGFISDAYLSIGGMYRTSDALILNAMVEINDFALGMSYDINVSELSVATSGKGGFEFALRYSIPNSNKNKSFY